MISNLEATSVLKRASKLVELAPNRFKHFEIKKCGLEIYDEVRQQVYFLGTKDAPKEDELWAFFGPLWYESNKRCATARLDSIAEQVLSWFTP